MLLDHFALEARGFCIPGPMGLLMIGVTWKEAHTPTSAFYYCCWEHLYPAWLYACGSHSTITKALRVLQQLPPQGTARGNRPKSLVCKEAYWLIIMNAAWGGSLLTEHAFRELTVTLSRDLGWWVLSFTFILWGMTCSGAPESPGEEFYICPVHWFLQLLPREHPLIAWLWGSGGLAFLVPMGLWQSERQF